MVTTNKPHLKMYLSNPAELERAKKLIESDPLYKGSVSDYLHNLLANRAKELGKEWERENSKRGGYNYPADAVQPAVLGHGGFRVKGAGKAKKNS